MHRCFREINHELCQRLLKSDRAMFLVYWIRDS